MTDFATLIFRISDGHSSIGFSWADGPEVTAMFDTVFPNDNSEIWISQEGYEIRLSEGQITKQNHGCTAQMQNYFGYLYEFHHILKPFT